jgi:hypothetical protein
LDQRDNQIEMFAWNAEGRSLQGLTQKVAGAPEPSRIDIRGLPQESTSTSPHFDLPFQIRSTRPLKRVDLRLVNRFRDSFLFLPIPQPDENGGYRFQHTLELEEGVNEIHVEATDDAGNRALAVRKLSLVAEPVFVKVDQLESGASTIAPALFRGGRMTFRQAAPEALVAIRGQILCPDGYPRQSGKGQLIKAWVNGFLQTVTTLPALETARRRQEFQLKVVLNQPEDNQVELEFPGLPQAAQNRLAFNLDCRRPQTGQRLHLILIGFGLPKDVDVVENAQRALDIRNGRSPAFSDVRIYGPLTGRVRATQVKYQLELFRAATQNRFRDSLNDVLMVYYYGQEAGTDQRFVLVTSENRLNPMIADRSVITSEYLCGFLNQVHGAHLVFLDVGKPMSAGKIAQTPLGAFPQLGILRSSWLDTEWVPPDQTLPAALAQVRQLKPQAQVLKEVAGALSAVYRDPSWGYDQLTQFQASVPPALEDLVLRPSL